MKQFKRLLVFVVAVFAIAVATRNPLATAYANSSTSEATCTISTWLKSGESLAAQKINIDLKDGPYGSRFGSTTQRLEGGELLSLTITQMGLSGPRTVWRLEVGDVGQAPQITSGEVTGEARVSHLLLRSELAQKSLEISCPL